MLQLRAFGSAFRAHFISAPAAKLALGSLQVHELMTDIAIDETFLINLINAEIEESLTLEYKAADALARSDRAKKEMTKDVAAMANSSGGRIIYGIRENRDAATRHLPESLDPCLRSSFSKEWLEQVLRM